MILVDGHRVKRVLDCNYWIDGPSQIRMTTILGEMVAGDGPEEQLSGGHGYAGRPQPHFKRPQAITINADGTSYALVDAGTWPTSTFVRTC